MEQEEIVKKLTEHDSKIGVNEKRIHDLELKTDKLETLTLAVQKLAISVENMTKEQTEYRQKQNELANRLLEVEQAPAKDKAACHDRIMGVIGQCILSAVVGGVLAYIGFK